MHGEESVGFFPTFWEHVNPRRACCAPAYGGFQIAVRIEWPPSDWASGARRTLSTLLRCWWLQKKKAPNSFSGSSLRTWHRYLPPTPVLGHFGRPALLGQEVAQTTFAPDLSGGPLETVDSKPPSWRIIGSHKKDTPSQVGYNCSYKELGPQESENRANVTYTDVVTFLISPTCVDSCLNLPHESSPPRPLH